MTASAAVLVYVMVLSVIATSVSLLCFGGAWWLVVAVGGVYALRRNGFLFYEARRNRLEEALLFERWEMEW